MSASQPYRDQPNPAENPAWAQDELRADAVERLGALEDMAMDFAGWLHRQAAVEMETGGEKAADKVRTLSNSFGKAARAVRHIVVLRHEVAGLRLTPGTRVAGPANENTAPAGRKPAQTYFPPGRDRSDYDRYNDMSDEERRDLKEREEEGFAYMKKLAAALQVDAEAAGPEMAKWAARESIAVKLSVIAQSIPHPTLDRAMADVELDRLWENFAPKKYPRQRPTGPPERPDLSHLQT